MRLPARWHAPLKALAQLTRSLRQERKSGQALTLPPTPELAELTREIAALARPVLPCSAPRPAPAGLLRRPHKLPITYRPRSSASMTRSGLYDAPPETEGPSNPNMSGEFSTVDMVNRLEPAAFQWIDSSPAEQEFLGWTIAELRQKSFLDVVRSDDRASRRESPPPGPRAGRSAGPGRLGANRAGQDPRRRGQYRRPLRQNPRRHPSSLPFDRRQRKGQGRPRAAAPTPRN